MHIANAAHLQQVTVTIMVGVVTTRPRLTVEAVEEAEEASCLAPKVVVKTALQRYNHLLIFLAFS